MEQFQSVQQRILMFDIYRNSAKLGKGYSTDSYCSVECGTVPEIVSYYRTSCPDWHRCIQYWDGRYVGCCTRAYGKASDTS